jgi:AraC family transcriptional regulator
MIVLLHPNAVRAQPSQPVKQEPWDFGSFILHGKALNYSWTGRGFLSIKAFFQGQAFYTVGDGYHVVNDASYLVLNHEQAYSISIESDTSVESFCLFFAPGFAEEVLHSFIRPTDHLIDEPEKNDSLPIHFFERTYPHDNLLSPTLLRLRTVLTDRRYEQGWLEEQFHEIMQQLLHVHRNVYREVETLPLVRSATREEVYRRLYRARDYAYAMFDQPITLVDMAHVACLSPNYFLRRFKQVFHQTPHQYIITRRLEQAQQLLVKTDCSVTDVCFSIGFESLGSFSRLFRQRTGSSPEAYRRQKR